MCSISHHVSQFCIQIILSLASHFYTHLLHWQIQPEQLLIQIEHPVTCSCIYCFLFRKVCFNPFVGASNLCQLLRGHRRNLILPLFIWATCHSKCGEAIWRSQGWQQCTAHTMPALSLHSCLYVGIKGMKRGLTHVPAFDLWGLVEAREGALPPTRQTHMGTFQIHSFSNITLVLHALV